MAPISRAIVFEILDGTVEDAPLAGDVEPQFRAVPAEQDRRYVTLGPVPSDPTRG
jgi:hypothetical protein